jgi:prepilin-type N-terminal cleavage/methylation domain-containing protein/prepilin-type processing-associated H-X9-DG protein
MKRVRTFRKDGGHQGPAASSAIWKSQWKQDVLPTISSGRHLCPAFTLIELLVVIAIVAILSAILVPVLSRAKESGRGVMCKNNLREFGVAAYTYSLDYRGHLPFVDNWLFDDEQQGIYPSLTPPIYPDLTTGKLYYYLNDKLAYLCPTDKQSLAGTPTPAASSEPASWAKYPRDYSYAINCCLCHQSDPSGFINSPSGTLLFMEPLLNPVDYSGVTGPGQSCFQPSTDLATRHNGLGNLLKADGHVDSLNVAKWNMTKRTKAFWFPTPDYTDPGANDLSVAFNLQDP